MNSLTHIVDHGNECFEANCLGWRDVISRANHLLTCHDLGGFATLCNQSFDALEGEYYLYRTVNSCSLYPLPTFGSGMRSRVMRRTKRVTTWGATMEAGVVASNPQVDANTSLHITSR